MKLSIVCADGRLIDYSGVVRCAVIADSRGCDIVDLCLSFTTDLSSDDFVRVSDVRKFTIIWR